MSEGRLLVVDDEETIRNTLSEMLAFFGKESDCVASGEHAISNVTESPDRYQAVLLDLSMPGLDGTETFLKLHDIVPDLPVYIVSGYSGDELEKELMSVGISGLLSKPFRINQIKKILSELDKAIS